MKVYHQIKLQDHWTNPRPGFALVMDWAWRARQDTQVLNQFAKQGWQYVGPGTASDHILLVKDKQ